MNIGMSESTTTVHPRIANGGLFRTAQVLVGSVSLLQRESRVHRGSSCPSWAEL
jgi:hypothetical protein